MSTSFNKLFSHLQVRVFSFFAISLLAILLIATGIESLIVSRLLTLSPATQQQLHALAAQANEFIKRKDIAGLTRWESQQAFTLYTLNPQQQPITQRPIHPHFVFKLQYSRQIEQPMGDRVRKPLIMLPLSNRLEDDQPLSLVIQLNADLHPAQQLNFALWTIRSVVGITVLLLFSYLLSRYLITPLQHLKRGTEALAQGKLDTRIANHFSTKEPEFYHLATEFDHMAEQLQQGMQNQKRLLRDVSHELRTPLARQELALHLLEGQLDDRHQASINRLRTEGEQMSRLINTILDYSRLNNAYIQLNYSQFDVGTLQSQIQQDCQFEAKPEQQIHWHNHDKLILHTDRQYLCRAIENIVRNALKYAGDQCEIHIETRAIDQDLHITIADNGPGIKQEELSSLFNPFTRLDEARHSSQGGFGLGLAIVKQCMKLLAGDVAATNHIDGGLMLTLTLPITHPLAPAALNSPESSKTQNATSDNQLAATS
ncbi:ATP-binding protein [Shewanella waksmanii]|uniref:ATP-binding protein n=1 Tax=Shewanella waksmanii TaxID=213783 RepID=UPI003736012D